MCVTRLERVHRDPTTGTGGSRAAEVLELTPVAASRSGIPNLRACRTAGPPTNNVSPVTLRRSIGLPIISLAVALSLGGCVVGSSSGSNPPPAASASAPGSKTLDFATVESVTAPIFQKDPNCGYGQWSKNSTGIDEEFRSSAKVIQQFDCYLSKDDVGGLPKRVQQSIFVEFDDANTATAFAKDQSSLYSSLTDGTRVVVAGLGLETVDMKAYLNDLKNACGCGEVVVAGS